MTDQAILDSVDASKSTLVANPGTILANGVEQSTITFTAKDSTGNIVTGLNDGDVEFVHSHDVFKVDSSAKATGVFTTTFTATEKSTATITVKVGGKLLPFKRALIQVNHTQEQACAAIDNSNSEFTADKSSILANNIDIATLTFKAIDQFGDPVADLAKESLTFTPSGVPTDKVTLVVTSNVDDNNIPKGTFIVTLKGQQGGDVTVSVAANNYSVGDIINGIEKLNQTVQVKLNSIQTVADIAKEHSVLSASPDNIDADGIAFSIIKFIAKDIKQDVLSELTESDISFTANQTSDITLNNFQNHKDGSYTTQLSGKRVGDVKVNVNTIIGMADVNINLKDITQRDLKASLSLSNSTLKCNLPAVDADGTSFSTITFEARDKSNNPVKGLTEESIGFTAISGNGILSTDFKMQGYSNNNNSGNYSINITGTKECMVQVNVGCISGMHDTLVHIQKYIGTALVNAKGSQPVIADIDSVSFNKDALSYVLGGNGGKREVESSNPAVATIVPATTQLHFTGAGDTNITVSEEGTDRYNPQSTTYKLTINQSYTLEMEDEKYLAKGFDTFDVVVKTVQLPDGSGGKVVSNMDVKFVQPGQADFTAQTNDAGKVTFKVAGVDGTTTKDLTCTVILPNAQAGGIHKNIKLHFLKQYNNPGTKNIPWTWNGDSPSATVSTSIAFGTPQAGNFVYESSNPDVVSVDKDTGTLTCHKGGTVSITAKHQLYQKDVQSISFSVVVFDNHPARFEWAWNSSYSTTSWNIETRYFTLKSFNQWGEYIAFSDRSVDTYMEVYNVPLCYGDKYTLYGNDWVSTPDGAQYTNFQWKLLSETVAITLNHRWQYGCDMYEFRFKNNSGGNDILTTPHIRSGYSNLSIPNSDGSYCHPLW